MAQQLSDSIPVLIAVSGWLASHGLALRAQRKSQTYMAMDSARRDITSGLRAYQRNLSRTQGWLRAWSAHRITVAHGVPVDLRAESASLAELIAQHRELHDWSLRLEENEILFPATASARIALDRGHLSCMYALSDVHGRLLRESFEPATLDVVEAISAATPDVLERVDDLASLLEDLRIYLQNIVQGPLLDRRLPPRIPLDPNVPRLILRAGHLIVADERGAPVDLAAGSPYF